MWPGQSCVGRLQCALPVLMFLIATAISTLGFAGPLRLPPTLIAKEVPAAYIRTPGVESEVTELAQRFVRENPKLDYSATALELLRIAPKGFLSHISPGGDLMMAVSNCFPKDTRKELAVSADLTQSCPALGRYPDAVPQLETYVNGNETGVVRFGIIVDRLVALLESKSDLATDQLGGEIAKKFGECTNGKPVIDPNTFTSPYVILAGCNQNVLGRIGTLALELSVAEDWNYSITPHASDAVHLGFRSENYGGGVQVQAIPFQYVHLGQVTHPAKCTADKLDQPDSSDKCKTDFNVTISTDLHGRLDQAPPLADAAGVGDVWLGTAFELNNSRGVRVGIGAKAPSNNGFGTDYASGLLQLDKSWQEIHGSNWAGNVRLMTIWSQASSTNGGSNLTIAEPSLTYHFNLDAQASELRIAAIFARPSASAFDSDYNIRWTTLVGRDFELEAAYDFGAAGGASHHGYSVFAVYKF